MSLVQYLPRKQQNKKWIKLTQRTTHEYDVPLSRRTTALLDGASVTLVETVYVLLPTIYASRRTFHRLGEATGHVEIAFEDEMSV